MRSKETMNELFQTTSKIVLFDEFDCLLDVIKSRETMGSKHSDDDGSSMKLKIAMKFLDMAHAEKDEDKKKALMTQYENTLNHDDGKVDIQYLLTKFQGLESADGRCIIACTNHPDKIDSALKRKGRFDIIIKLGNATPRMTFDMVAYYFQITDYEKEELEKQFTELPNRLISPAELQDICANSNGPNETLEKVMARASFVSDNASVISEDSQTISVGTSNPHD
jgi:SpoVK/Ycf46/Vps4 family AAA+-type ATPase